MMWRKDAQWVTDNAAIEYIRRYEKALTAAEQMLHDQRNAVSKKAVEKYVARIAELENLLDARRGDVRDYHESIAELEAENEKLRKEVRWYKVQADADQ